MNWNLRYRVRSYLRSSLWIVPFAAIVLEQLLSATLYPLDQQLGWSGLGLGVEGAKGMVGAIINLTLTLIVFTFGALLIAIQVASGQYTPRIIATTLLNNNVIRYVVGLFVFTFIFEIKALDRIETTVPQLIVFVGGLLGFTCIISFLFLVDYVARTLRPVSLVRKVGENGLTVLESVYPETFNGAHDGEDFTGNLGTVTRTLIQRGTSGIVLAVNVDHLVAEAEKTNGIIEFAPQVGDFVGVGEPLFLLRDGAAAIDDHTLRSSIIFGPERTLEQDPLFAFRILVDIAIKALSAAINDPTTAVLAIDQLHRLLRRAGRRDLRTDCVVNRAGKTRVILRTPKWEDFVHLTFTEIRFYGADNVQIARRLRAMILNLMKTLPADRHPALQQELARLDRMLQNLYTLPEDLALARIPDPQGLGGSTEPHGLRPPE